MQLGVVFPQREIEGSVQQIVDFASGVESLGFSHVLVYDHVLGADPAEHPGWEKYTHEDPFHEPFTLLSFIAAITKLNLVTGVVILPQRQTALVAKQAAQVDWLSSGRLRLGVGLGWNHLEYEALGIDFGTRADRFEDQLAVMRALWQNPSVVVRSAHHSITGVGINPRPVHANIPVWVGSGLTSRPVERAGRLADGWMPLGEPGDAMTDAVARFRASAADAGRDPDALGLEARVNCRHGDVEAAVAETDYWRDLNATHVSFSTMDAGFTTIGQHLDFLTDVRTAVTSRPDRR